jgi:hypothetical protein
MADVIPHTCATDILLSEARQSGLRRTQTLAEGGEKVRFSLQNQPENYGEKYCPSGLTDIKRFFVQIRDIDRSRKIGTNH